MIGADEMWERPADILDYASEVEERERQAGIQRVLTENKMKPKGRCYNCDEPLAPDQLYCDADCGHDYEARLRAKGRT